MMKMKNEFTVVKLRRSLHDLPVGSVGTIVLTSEDHPTKSLVEFARKTGDPLVVAVENEDLEEIE